MKTVTHADYWNEVKECQKYLVTEYGKHHDELYDRLHELVDSHEYVIYTANYMPILQYTDNAEYGIDEGLIDVRQEVYSGGLDKLHQVLVYWAFYADIMEGL